MSLKIDTFTSSMMSSNVVILHDDETRHAIIMDPSFEPEQVLTFINNNSLSVEMILCTHGHFDHFAGLAYLLTKLHPKPKVGLHESDLALWRAGGGAVHFRIPIAVPEDPDIFLTENQTIHLGDGQIQIRHTPGHSPGSVVFYMESLHTAVVGDLIFHQGVGRTDLPGGSFEVLKNSIITQIFSLPPQTVLIPGHGPFTTVESEMQLNPYFQK